MARRSSRVAPDPPAEEEEEEASWKAALKSREAMLRKLGMKIAEDMQWNRVMHLEPAHGVVDKAIKGTDKGHQKKKAKEVEARKLKRFNCLLNLRVHFLCSTSIEKGAAEVLKTYEMETQDGVYLTALQKQLAKLLGVKKAKVLWVNEGGETIVLDSQRVFEQFADKSWNVLPWTLYAMDDSKKAQKAAKVTLHEAARALFDRYDGDANGIIERGELSRMLKEMDLSKLEVSEKLVDNFVMAEFEKLDKDGSDGICFSEFTEYVTNMTRWMRDELMVNANRKQVFSSIAAKSVATHMPPIELPPDGVVTTGALTLQVPRGALGPTDAKTHISMRTVCPHSVAYLSDSEKRKRGEFAFSPAVVIAAPAEGDGSDAALVQQAAANGWKFNRPLVLRMPHCFSPVPDEGMESLVMLGAPTGAKQWQVIDALSSADFSSPVTLDGDMLEVKLPFAGTFCAFSSPNVEDIAVARVHIFAAPEVPRDVPTSVRVHICPELPDVIEEMRLSERGEWGLTKEAGFSDKLYLYQGAKFEIKLGDETREVVWHGSRISTTLTLLTPTLRLSENDSAVSSAILITVLEGEGKRAAVPQVVAKRAGISQINHSVPFEARLKREVRPPPPVDLQTLERTQYDAVIQWYAPATKAGREPPKIIHYALELSVTGPSGTYYAFDELWAGDAEVLPEELLRVPPDDLTAGAEKSKGAKSRYMAEEKELTESSRNPKAEGASAEAATVADGVEDLTEAAETTAAAPAEEKPEAVVALQPYTLVVRNIPRELFGRLRIRCWSEGELRPSVYSAEAKLPRYVGKVEAKKSHAEVKLDQARDAYFASRPKASLNEWGGSSSKNAFRVAGGAPVPYLVPELPSTPELQNAGTVLANFYTEMGVVGGGSGQLLGLRIDHVLHAVAEGRVTARLDQPLVALCEVCYVDVLLPLLDTVVVLQNEWIFVDEKLSGMTKLISEIAGFHYDWLVPQLKSFLKALQEVYEMMRQCEDGALVALQLKDPEYARSLKKTLTDEGVDRICDTLWRLSTHLLKMLLVNSEVRGEAGDEIDASDLHPGDFETLALQALRVEGGLRQKRRVLSFLSRH